MKERGSEGAREGGSKGARERGSEGGREGGGGERQHRAMLNLADRDSRLQLNGFFPEHYQERLKMYKSLLRCLHCIFTNKHCQIHDCLIQTSPRFRSSVPITCTWSKDLKFWEGT